MIRLAEAGQRTARADAARNRAIVLAAATRIYSSSEIEPSMREIAREAGVGIATLFRHFPTREALVDAVYRDQVERLTVGARELLLEFPPAEALRRWMTLFGSWLATKHGMTDTLLAMVDAGEVVPAHTRSELLGAVSLILDAGQVSGELRSDLTAADVTAGTLGVFAVAGRSGDAAQAERLLDLIIDGLTSVRRRLD